MKPRIVPFAIVGCLLLAACGGSSTSGNKPLSGKKVEVAAVWSGNEQKNFQAVLSAFSDSTGAQATFTSTGDNIGTVLGSRIASNSPPDVAILPQPGLLHDLATKGSLKELDSDTANLVSQNYAPVWKDLATVNGKFYGVFFKATNKSTVWYNTHAFTNAGVNPPKTFDEFKTALTTLSASGVKPLSIGGADGWTLTDWFENVYLRQAGPDKYEALTKHTIKWTDDSVKSALRTLATIFTNQNVYGGLSGALNASFPDSVANITGTSPKAAVVYEADFTEGNLLGATPPMVPGTDFNFFPFPDINGSPPSVMFAGDVAVRLTDNAAGVELVKYLASPQAAEIWAAKGGYDSANNKVDPSKYPDAIAKAAAQALASAQVAKFDMSDQAPAAFGGTKGSGEWADLQTWLKNPNNIDAVTAQLEKDAAAAFGS
jgi:ABC-type glycerol-3-phosphate transport system substrate-binding protein